MSIFNQFRNHQYLNLETRRKNGASVKTPVWFAQDDDALHIWTEADSGKAKRIRNFANVNIAPCRGDGALLGEWQPALATEDKSAQAVARVRGLFSKKYGVLFTLFALMGKMRRAQHTTIAIKSAE